MLSSATRVLPRFSPHLLTVVNPLLAPKIFRDFRDVSGCLLFLFSLLAPTTTPHFLPLNPHPQPYTRRFSSTSLRELPRLTTQKFW